jgi:hypothetical protein
MQPSAPPRCAKTLDAWIERAVVATRVAELFHES